MSAPRNFVLVQPVWVQASGNYDAERTLRTLVVSPAMTVGEIMEWAGANPSSTLSIPWKLPKPITEDMLLP